MKDWIQQVTLPMTLVGTVAAIVIIQPQLGISLTSPEVSKKVEAFTVKIDGKEPGTGVIISKQGTTYRVLTNWHVVDSGEAGQYTVETSDGKVHPATNTTQLNGADLAIIYFESTQSYPLPTRGNSDNLAKGQTVYFGGYPRAQEAVARNRVYRFSGMQSISGFLLSADIKDGYEIIFTGPAFPGMSGSPILDENANLIGIYGRAEEDPTTKEKSLYGIRISTAVQLAKQANIDIGSSVARTENSSPSISSPTETPRRVGRPTVVTPTQQPTNPICSGYSC